MKKTMLAGVMAAIMMTGCAGEMQSITNSLENATKWSKTSYEEDQRAAASSRQTSVTELKKLAKNKDYRIRSAVALNKSTPADVLDILVRDKNGIVVNNALCNKNLSDDAAMYIVNNNPAHLNELVRCQHRFLSANVVDAIMKNRMKWLNKKYKKNILNHPNLSVDTLIAYYNADKNLIKNYKNPFFTKKGAKKIRSLMLRCANGKEFYLSYYCVDNECKTPVPAFKYDDGMLIKSAQNRCRVEKEYIASATANVDRKKQVAVAIAALNPKITEEVKMKAELSGLKTQQEVKKIQYQQRKAAYLKKKKEKAKLEKLRKELQDAKGL